MPLSMSAVRIAYCAILGLSSTVAHAADDFPPGDAHDLVVKTCTQCHNADPIVYSGKTKEDWSAIVRMMIGNGAVVADADFNRIVDYLAKSFPAK